MSNAYRVVHRRNHAAPGIVLLIAGGLILLSSALPLLQFTGPGVGVLAKGLGMTLTGDGSYEPDPAGLWYWTGGLVCLFALVLLVTRIRGLGALWRILAILPVLVVAVVAAFWWYFLSDPSRFLAEQDQSLSGTIRSGITSLLEGSGAYSITPGLGLVVMSAAAVLGVIGAFLPAGKTEKYVPLPGQPYRGQVYPGQAHSGQVYPGQAFPGQGYPGQAHPDQPYPGQYPPTGS